VFLLELIVVVIVVVFLLFFFNRVFGFVVSYIIRTYTWHRHKAYIHVDAIQLSFLAGRILFKNFRYQSRNQSIYLLKGHLTWRYWIRRTRVRQKNCQVSEIANLKLPCRVHLEVEGVEWFVYNRTPAYDEIIAVVEGKQKEKGPGHENGGLGRSETTRSSADRTSDASLTKQDSDEIAPHKAVTHEASFFLHLLPISLVAKKGAIILGNTNTPSIVVAQFVEADMAIDAAESRSKFDLYKMVYNVNFTRPTVQIKMNIDYKESLLDRASHVVEEAEAKTQVPTYTLPS